MRILATLVFCSIFTLSACSTNPNKEPVPRMSELFAQLTGQNGRACVRSHDIDGYGTAKNQVITIDGGRKYYLATTFQSCTDIDTSARALFDGRYGEVCGNSLAKVHTRDESCVIRSMYEFESREAAFAVLEKAQELRQAVVDKNDK